MLFIGDDWAEGHHDIEVEDDIGHRLARMRLPEGVEGLARLHEVEAEHRDPDRAGGDDPADGAIVVGIETDRGEWVSALLACGYQVYAINPRQLDTGTGIPPREPNPMPAMPMFSPRSSGRTGTITARSQETPRRSRS